MLVKRQYGMSIQALLRRLTEIITGTYHRQWCVDINRLGWRKHEPLEMPPEQPQWLRRSVLHALAEGLISQEEAAAMTGELMRGEMTLPALTPILHEAAAGRAAAILAEQAENCRPLRSGQRVARDGGWRPCRVLARNPPKRGKSGCRFQPDTRRRDSEQRPALVVNSDAIGRLPIKLVPQVTGRKPAFAGNLWHVRVIPDRTNGLEKELAVDVLQLRGVDAERLSVSSRRRPGHDGRSRRGHRGSGEYQ